MTDDQLRQLCDAIYYLASCVLRAGFGLSLALLGTHVLRELNRSK